MNRNIEYIQQLQERNRLKKLMMEKTEAEMRQQELERGFSTHFRGAHAVKSDGVTPMAKPVLKPVVRMNKVSPLGFARRLLPTDSSRGLQNTINEHNMIKTTHFPDKDNPAIIENMQDGGNDQLYCVDGVDATNVGENHSDYPAARLFGEENYDEHDFESESPRYYDVEKSGAHAQQPPTHDRVIPGLTDAIGFNIEKQKASPETAPPALVDNIQCLSKEQKLALLQLLQDSLQSDSSASTMPTVSEVQVTGPAMKSPGMSPGKSPGSSGVEDAEFSQRAHRQPIPASSSESQSCAKLLSVRLKLYTTWSEGSRFVSLHSLRLRYFASEAPVSRDDLATVPYVDVLQLLNLKVVVGMQALKLTADMASMNKALVQGVSAHTSRSAAGWRMALPSNSQAVELLFECPDAEGLFKILADRLSPGVIIVPQNLKLLVWNVSGNQGPDGLSAVKDVDIVLNQAVNVFSGVVPTASSDVSVSRCTERLVKNEPTASHRETPPHVVIDLYPNARSDEKNPKQTGATTAVAISRYNDNDELEGTSLVRLGTSGGPSFDAVDSAKPEWLRDDSTDRLLSSRLLRDYAEDSAQRQLLSTPVSRASGSRGSRRRAEDGNAAVSAVATRSISAGSEALITSQNLSASKKVVGSPFGDSPAGSTSGSPSKKTRRHPRRNRSTNASLGSLLVDEESAGADKIVTLGAERVKEGDMRRSLDALSFAEYNNLNRLDRAVLDSSVLKGSASAEEFCDSKETTVNWNMFNALPCANMVETPDNKDSAEEKKSAPMTKRGQRIQIVNDKVNHVLNDLVDILSTIPARLQRNGSNSVLPSPQPAIQIPEGKTLVIKVLSTWGDSSYVGLNGIEVYDREAKLVVYPLLLHQQRVALDTLANYVSSVAVSEITANPPDLSSLPGYEEDPRKVLNLLDLHNSTKDDLHHWLAPQRHVVNKQDSGDDLATIKITFSHPLQLSCLRIFNFNKSRTHNQRGARLIEALLDGAVVFSGELPKGGSHVVTFSTQAFRGAPEELAKVFAAVDEWSRTAAEAGKRGLYAPVATATTFRGVTEDQDLLESSLLVSRPPTAVSQSKDAANLQGANAAEQSYIFDSLAAEDADGDRQPDIISPVELNDSGMSSSFDKMMHDIQALAPASQSTTAAAAAVRSPDLSVVLDDKKPQHLSSAGAKYSGYSCTSMTLFLLESYGDKEYIGLSGLQVLDPNLGIIARNIKRVFADPNKDMQAISGLQGGVDGFRMNALLVKNMNDVSRSQSSWLAPFTYSPALLKSRQYATTKAALSNYKRDYQYLCIEFEAAQSVGGLRVWNYNASGGTSRGVKTMLAYLENQEEAFGILLPVRISNGYSFIPFHQTLLFQNFLASSFRAQSYEVHNLPAYHNHDKLSYCTPKVRQSYEHNNYIVGMQLCIKLHSNHGDLYYIGLDKLEVILEDNTIVDLQNLHNIYLGMIVAYPHSINILPKSNCSSSKDQDLRCAEQLLMAGGCGYLAPLVNRMSDEERANSVSIYADPTLQSSHMISSTSFPVENMVLINFSRPVAIAAIRVRNYSRTPRRGVRSFSVELDRKVVYMGDLVPANEEAGMLGQTMVFSRNIKILNAYKDAAIFGGKVEQDVLYINERQVMVRSKNMYDSTQADADLKDRPTTSFFA